MIRDNPCIIVFDGNIDAAIRQLRKRVSTSNTFKLLKRRKMNSSVQARRRDKAAIADLKRCRRHNRKMIRKKT